MYGGGTSGGTAGFDGLVQSGGRHYLAGFGQAINGGLSSPYGGGGKPHYSMGSGGGGNGGGGLPITPPNKGSGGPSQIGFDPDLAEKGKAQRKTRDGSTDSTDINTLGCDCFDCRKWLNLICDMENADLSWHTICCPDEDDGNNGIAMCIQAVDPCSRLGYNVTCHDLVCGNKDYQGNDTLEVNTCLCRSLLNAEQNSERTPDNQLDLAWSSNCNHPCRGTSSPWNYECGGKDRQCATMDLELPVGDCAFTPPSPYHVCIWNAEYPGSDAAEQVCNAAENRCRDNCAWLDFGCQQCCTAAALSCRSYYASGPGQCPETGDFES
jgi:hypothetical protein